MLPTDSAADPTLVREPVDQQPESAREVALPPAPTRSGRRGLAGEVGFASPEGQVQRTTELLAAGALIVRVPPIPASMRGLLAEHIDEHIERELGACGAPSPYLTEWSSMPEDGESRIANQLFRARSMGAAGIAITLGSLASTARPTLAPEDSATIRLLARAAASGPIVVLIDDGDAVLGAFGPPAPLASLLRVTLTPPAPPPLPLPSEAIMAAAEAPIVIKVPVVHAPSPPPPPVVETAVDTVVAEKTELQVAPEPAPAAITEPPISAPLPVDPQAAKTRRQTAGVPVAGPSDFWRGWALALGAVRGPQPLATFERLFVESYVPLATAIAAGLDDPRAIRAYDEFRMTFERSYAEASTTFGVTTRRPRLVMDIHDIASRQARLHNARAAHILIVDSMRYDLGALVRDSIASRPDVTASLTAETLLFSTLPTTTFRQLETIARGVDALRDPAEPESVDSLRGRPAEVVRRMRIGSREIYKLDVIASMLETPEVPTPVTAHFDVIAERVADAIVDHARTLATRTLLFVAGDHGFVIDRRGRVTHGGACPEEVLVPAFAYLVGALH